MLPLFHAFPDLSGALPHLPLAALPTPLEEVPALAAELGVGRLFVKRDDQTAQPYGGNKARKLEWLLGDARAKGAKSVLTFGAAGSNHALATAIYARQAGMHPIAMLMPQPAEPVVRSNLLRHLGPGTDLHYFETKAALKEGVRRVLTERGSPYVIPLGGSSPVGAVGYVNAALELIRQCAEEHQPSPGRIYTACGTMGTAIGLLLGLAYAGAATRVEAVRVTEEELVNLSNGRALFEQTAAHLHAHDAAVSMPPFPNAKFSLREAFFGDGYGVHTQADREAAALFEQHVGVPLECTYTAKAFRALMADAEAGALRDQCVVFLDTYSAHAPGVDEADFRELPEALHGYFK